MICGHFGIPSKVSDAGPDARFVDPEEKISILLDSVADAVRAASIQPWNARQRSERKQQLKTALAELTEALELAR